MTASDWVTVGLLVGLAVVLLALIIIDPADLRGEERNQS